MKRSFFSKIFIGYLLIILALSSLILVLSLNTIREFYRDTLTGHLKTLAYTLNSEVAQLLDTGRANQLDGFIKSLGRQIRTRVTIIAMDGTVLADSEENIQSMENHSHRPEVVEALQGRTGKSIRFSSTADRDMLYVAVPLEKDGKLTGAIRTSLFLGDIDNLLTKLNYHVAGISLGIVFIALLAAFLISNSVVRPIKDLTLAARKVASGDFSARVFLKTKDELRTLAESFNRMNEEMEKMFSELGHQKEELKSIIDSLQEGLLVLDKQGRVIRSNESFRKIIGNQSVDGRHYWEIMRNPRFPELLKKAGLEKKKFMEDLTLADRVFMCSVTPLQGGDGIVSIFYDITEIKNTEKIKKDFVINVSHELRTPLTAIKGYAETLRKEVDTAPGKKYLETVERNTNRLINIVNDLMLLSSLEEKAALELEDIDLRGFLENVVRIFDQRLKDKQISLVIDVKESLPPIKADLFKLEQMLVNLLDNAVKYTDRGEITVSMDVHDKRVRIQVRDTGIGIPKNDIPRIFERFYVVDKSRSRKSGGTGLGLSIVKHIVLLHHGTIDIESAPGKGTSITVTLPTDLSASS
jgi:two-component system, OmpR family, phosphate regulon sensor histidine kinase PhoR